MSFGHLLNETCYVEDAKVDGSGRPILDEDSEIVYSGVVRAVKCSHIRRQRVFRTQGATGSAGERISDHELVTASPIAEDARIWIPGADNTDPNSALTPKGLEHMARPRGGLVLYHTFL